MAKEKINRRMSRWVSLNILVGKVHPMGWFVCWWGRFCSGWVCS
ncbi:MAG: hypothetical protein O7G87_14645 [bacterium]|nr:hypothetical protein [bacterium]